MAHPIPPKFKYDGLKHFEKRQLFFPFPHILNIELTDQPKIRGFEGLQQAILQNVKKELETSPLIHAEHILYWIKLRIVF